jgi:hypothetical protein
MPSRITTVAIPANAAWKITNDASKQALIEAALRLILTGGDSIPGRAPDRVDESQLIVNLRTDDEVRRGLPVLLAPTVTFGKLRIVDRDEIEGYRSIHQLLRDYLDPDNQKKTKKPISIAVFGPPGSGKSFGVGEVAQAVLAELNQTPRREPLAFNLAQFSEPDQLSRAFLGIRGEGTDVPLAFFDEFDSSLGGVELGWLRYFLAPMQDGEFFFGEQRNQIGRAILVFAGGTSASLRAFSREEGSTEQDRVRFVEAKGPDFVSRLSGNINVLGVNRREDIPDQAYVLRRAVIIRSQLRDLGLIGRTKRALVDKGFLRRLLEIGRYKHGARSISMILKMCVGRNGMLHLPPADQLMMHIEKNDAEILLS